MIDRLNPAGTISTSELLDAVPVRNRAIVVEQQSDAAMVVAVPLRERWYMRPPVRWVLPFSRVRRVGLDSLGAEVWRMCDGVQSTERIVELFAAAHNLTFHESRLSVLTFLRELTKRGLVVMVGAVREGSAA